MSSWLFSRIITLVGYSRLIFSLWSCAVTKLVAIHQLSSVHINACLIVSYR